MSFMIKNDVIESFNAAVANPENTLDAGISWDFVSSDMHMDLSGVYNFGYIDECFDILVEKYIFDGATAYKQQEA